jgi:hypothetical protein
MGVIARHYDALCRLLEAYTESRIASLGDVERLVQRAEWAINRHVYPVMSALDAMDQFVIEWYTTNLITEEQTKKRKAEDSREDALAKKHEKRIQEISKMTENEAKNKLLEDVNRSGESLVNFVRNNGFWKYFGEDTAQEMKRTAEKWTKRFKSDEFDKAFEARVDELYKVTGIEGYKNEEDVDKNLRVLRYMVRLAETKIPLIERIVARITNGGLVLNKLVKENEKDPDAMRLEEIDGEQRLIVRRKSLAEWAEFGKYFIRTYEIIKEIHDVKCRTKPSDKASEFGKIIDRELKDLTKRIDDDSGVLSEGIKKAGSVADIGRVNADISYRLMERNMMIKTIKESVENVVAPTLSYDYSGRSITDALKNEFEKVRTHKENVFQLIIDKEVEWLTGHSESLTHEVDSAKTVDNLKKILLYISEERQNELNTVMKWIYDITDLVHNVDLMLYNGGIRGIGGIVDTGYISHRIEEIQMIKDATNGKILKLNLYKDITSKVAKRGREIQSSSLPTSFGRYVHRVAKHSARVPRRAWIA